MSLDCRKATHAMYRLMPKSLQALSGLIWVTRSSNMVWSREMTGGSTETAESLGRGKRGPFQSIPYQVYKQIHVYTVIYSTDYYPVQWVTYLATHSIMVMWVFPSHPLLCRGHITFHSERMVVPHRYEILKTTVNMRKENIVEAKKVQFIVNVEDIDVFHMLVMEDCAATENIPPQPLNPLIMDTAHASTEGSFLSPPPRCQHFSPPWTMVPPDMTRKTMCTHCCLKQQHYCSCYIIVCTMKV